MPPASELEIPTIAVRSDGVPLWVAGSTAFDTAGNLRDDLFSPPTRARLHQLRDLNPRDCTYAAVAPSLEIHERLDSLHDLASSATSVLAGTVADAEAGFYDGTPGTLFAIDVNTALKRKEGVPSNGTIYLFVGVGEIATPRGRICGRGARGTPVPTVGDEVMFFAHLTPLDAAGRIFAVDPRKALFLQSKTELVVPPALMDSHAFTDLAGAISSVRAIVGRDRGDR